MQKLLDPDSYRLPYHDSGIKESIETGFGAATPYNKMADTVGSFVDRYKSSKKDADSYIRRELFKQFDITKGPIQICADISYIEQNNTHGKSGEWVTTLTLPDPAPKKIDGTTLHTDVKEYLESFHKKSISGGGRKTRTGKRRKRCKSRRRGKRR